MPPKKMDLTKKIVLIIITLVGLTVSISGIVVKAIDREDAKIEAAIVKHETTTRADSEAVRRLEQAVARMEALMTAIDKRLDRIQRAQSDRKENDR